MKIKSQQAGSINVLVIPLILAVVFFFGALAFGLWAYSSRQDYKDNVDAKIATAVGVAQKETATEKDNEFIEREKQPLKDYRGPASAGTLSIKYPKTWAAYIDESDDGLEAYFHPNVVPGLDSEAAYALRVQVADKSYSEELKSFDSSVKAGKTKASPYKPVNVEGVVGTQLTGDIGDGKTGTLILLPLRDKTIKLWTEADQFSSDFVNNILANFKFVP
jgi:hypothetical protein